MHLLPLLIFIGTAHALLTPNFTTSCTTLAQSIKLDYPFTVNIAQYLPPNATINYASEGLNTTCADNVGYPIPIGVCRLNLRVETSSSSEIYMEVWLPENWAGRVLMTGNGALAGCIQYADLSYGASNSFATFGANAGHNGTSAGAMYLQPEVLQDYSQRAITVGTLVGQSITQQFFGRQCGKSYYLGCSTGGRQGWKAVQETPELFDGVVVGAPALNFWGFFAFMGFGYQNLGFNGNDTLVSLVQWGAVQREVFRQCDGLDGVGDRILEEPDACVLDWTPLLCSSSNTNSSTCFTPAQVEAASKLFKPVTYNGTLLHPGHRHGYEISLISALYQPEVQVWLPEVFRYIVYSNLSWDPTTFTLADASTALHLNPANLHTFNSDISAFRDRGGKILTWHGMADGILTSEMSDLYYENVRSTLNASVAELDGFYRYFRASGVGHCDGGPGANFLGQMGGAVVGEGSEENLLMRIVKWVEDGDAPEFIRGTKFVGDRLDGEVAFRRRHCKYPAVNRYLGSGNGTDEESWECVEG